MSWEQDLLPLPPCNPPPPCDPCPGCEIKLHLAVNVLVLPPARPSPDFGPLLLCQESGPRPQPHGKSPLGPRPGREPQGKWRGQMGAPGSKGRGRGGRRQTPVLRNQQPPQTRPTAETPKGKVTPPAAPVGPGTAAQAWRPGESPYLPGALPSSCAPPPIWM